MDQESSESGYSCRSNQAQDRMIGQAVLLLRGVFDGTLSQSWFELPWIISILHQTYHVLSEGQMEESIQVSTASRRRHHSNKAHERDLP